MVSTSYEGDLRVLDIETGRRLRTARGRFSIAAPDGLHALCVSKDGVASLDDVLTGKPRWTLPDMQHLRGPVAFSPAGDAVFFAPKPLARDPLLIVDLLNGRVVSEPAGHKLLVSAAQFTSDGARLVTGAKDGSVRLWDVRTGADSELLAVREGISPFTGGQFGSYHGIEALTITPDNRYVAAAGDDFVFRVWEISTGRMAASFRTDAKVRHCAASPRGHRFVAGDMSGRVHFLDFPNAIHAVV